MRTRCNRGVRLPTRRDFAGLIREREYTLGAEIGVYQGKFSMHLLASCPRLSLVLVDPWDGSAITGGYNPDEVFSDACGLVDRFGPERARIVREKSPAAAGRPEVSGLRFDFIYIDGDHSREAVTADIHAWWLLLRDGGVLAGHDYNNRGGKRVKAAVDAVFREVNTTEERCASWWVEKVADSPEAGSLALRTG